jgi:MscS family membrane protein
MKNIGLFFPEKFLEFCERICALNRPALRAFFAGAILLSPGAAPAQSLSGLLGTSPPASAKQAPVDPLNRTTPRSAIFNFLEACHTGRYRQAARYLDLSKVPAVQRYQEGPKLAKQLADILDRDPHFEVDLLSDTPAGNLNDGLAPDMEALVQLNADAESPALLLQRIQEQGIEVWVVSSDSVLRISDVDAMEGESEIGKKMPSILVKHKILDTPLWIWIALAALALLLFVLSRLLSRLFLAICTPLADRFAKSLRSYRLESLTDPLRLLISLVVFRAAMEIVTPSALLRDYLLKLLAFLATLGVAALAMRSIDIASTHIRGRSGTERALAYSVFPLGLRIVRIGVFLIAGLVILASWGYNTNAILAGLGVGGLAVALAAQKTIENLFGAVALISDRPVLVGDFCQFGTLTGTVEDIGLRSTRIRTNGRTMVTIPNSSFSTMTIENFSRRDRIWFHPTLRLRRDTAPEKVGEMMDATVAVLRDHPMVQIGDVPVRFTTITDYSLDLEVFAYVNTPDFDEYLKVQSALLLKLLEAGQRHGVGFAVPVAESITINPPTLNPAEASPSADLNSHPGEALPATHPPPG